MMDIWRGRSRTTAMILVGTACAAIAVSLATLMSGEAAVGAPGIVATDAQGASVDRPRMPALGSPDVTQKGDWPGLSLTIERIAAQRATKPAITDVRVARMLALYVRAGEAASALADAGRFRAIFEGDLNLRIRDFYQFSAEGRGRLTLRINGQVVFEAAGDNWTKAQGKSVRLNKGKDHLVATYESPSSGDAAVRVFWAPKGQLPEPVPPMVLTHDAAAEPTRQGERVREGRFLVGEFRCTRCHALTALTGHGTGAMPELSQDAPSFEAIGARLNDGWMAAWINNPRAMRSARVHMPRLFHASGDASQIDPRARDIGAYLATLGAANAPDSAKLPSDADTIETGGRTFANLNCVACHISPERTQPGTPAADEGRIELAHVKAKFRPSALVQFLLKPEAHYGWIPMPNFRLTAAEAQSLAAYLLSRPMKAVDHAASQSSGNVANGEKLLHSSGCLNCHAMKDRERAGVDRSAVEAKGLGQIPPGEWTRGCMAANASDRGDTPDFGFSAEQREAILAFAATDLSSLWRDSMPEFAERQIAAMRCTACHARDGKESLLATVLDAENQELKALHPPVETAGLEGVAPDQRAPMLTWTGGKLRPEWMGQFIAGQIAYKPRYYLSARMPGFPARGNAIATGLAEEHGDAPVYPPYPAADPRLAAIGRKLAGKAPNESFGCVQCHAINAQPPLAPFEAPAPNFMYVTQRLRLDYFYRWLHNPLRIDPESKMPRFDDDEGKTGITTILNGNAHQQFEALWNYMLLGKDMQPPAQ